MILEFARFAGVHAPQCPTKNVKNFTDLWMRFPPLRLKRGLHCTASRHEFTTTAADGNQATLPLRRKQIHANLADGSRPENWSEEEIDLLQRLRRQGIRLADIHAKHLPHRSFAAVMLRSYRLGGRRRQLWSQNEQELLFNMRKKGHTYGVIQKLLPQRTVAALRERYKQSQRAIVCLHVGTGVRKMIKL